MKKYKYEIIIFLVEAICMVVELVASRVLSPYFGNSNLVWTSVIGIILLSSSLGNYFGGKAADKKDNEKILKIVLLFASLAIMIIPSVQEFCLSVVTKFISDIKLGAIISTMILFFIPSTLLGFVIPIVLKLKLNSLDNTGKTSGKIYALSTMGGIFGTFIGGFLLVPNFGSIEILYVLAIILLALSFCIYLKKDKLISITFIIITLIDIILFCTYFATNKLNGKAVLEGKMNVYVSYDTEYGRVLIYNAYLNGEKIRALNIDGGYESATFADENKAYELVFDYTKKYDLMFESKNNVESVLLIGGARILISKILHKSL